MQKISLPYIEDYIEAISGSQLVANKAISINLARYDIQIIQSLSEQIGRGVSFTDRQAVLAHKIVIKYKRQLATVGIELGIHEDNAVFKMPTRTVDRSKTIRFQEGKIYIRFPYNEKLIEEIKESSKNIAGEFKFDRAARAWAASVTEPRVLWLQGLVSKHGFDLDTSLSELTEQIIAEHDKPYAIELRQTDTGLTITNAATSLVEYIEANLGGFGTDNLLRLIDNSNRLGFTVNQSILDNLLEKYSTRVQQLLTHQTIHAPLSLNDSLTDILEYANITNRWPIYVYENPESGQRALTQLEKVFNKDELLMIDPVKKYKTLTVNNELCVYLPQWNPKWADSIPLLVSMNALMVGPKKVQLIQCSEKVVYCSEFVYNTN